MCNKLSHAGPKMNTNTDTHSHNKKLIYFFKNVHSHSKGVVFFFNRRKMLCSQGHSNAGNNSLCIGAKGL